MQQHQIFTNGDHISDINEETSVNKDSSVHSLALMQWGQFLAHDLSLTCMIREEDGSLSDCKSCDSNKSKCSPIPIPEDDPYFPSKDPVTNSSKCMEFIRSLAVTSENNHRQEQLNLVTSWMDSSHVYGSSKCQADQLRKHQSGQLKSLSHPLGSSFKSLLPRHEANLECRSPSKLCFKAGDARVNEQPGLTSLHTLLVREHNRIALQLEYLNPNWNDEKIFQETRKIIIAINQHVTYNEYLPRILGQPLMNLYKLSDDYQYDNSCDPGILNEFATAAFRFGHSLIPNGFKISDPTLAKLTGLNMTENQKNDSMLYLRGHFLNPDITMSPLFVDEISQTLFNQPMSKSDNVLSEEIRNHFNETNGIFHSGADLAALNIQRGRDHGLKGYTRYKNFCSIDSLKRAGKQRSQPLMANDKFEQLFDTIDNEVISKLQQVYGHVEDIDLFTGGISERSVEGGLVGPTFGCIIANQFEKLRKCDRFWYETAGQNLHATMGQNMSYATPIENMYHENPGQNTNKTQKQIMYHEALGQNLGFTSEQLTQIKKVTLSSLVCNNLDQDSKFQLNAFDLPNETTNPQITCEKHPKLNLKFWSDNSEDYFCEVQGWLIKPGERRRIGAFTLCDCPISRGEPHCETTLDKSCQDLINELGPETVMLDKSYQDYCEHFFDLEFN